MDFLILVLSIWVFIKTTSYGIFEIKNNKNKFGGITVILFAFIGLILPNVMLMFR